MSRLVGELVSWLSGDSVSRQEGAGGGKKRWGGGDLLSHAMGSRSTIGAGELNDRVRDGNGCGLPAVATAPRV